MAAQNAAIIKNYLVYSTPSSLQLPVDSTTLPSGYVIIQVPLPVQLPAAVEVILLLKDCKENAKANADAKINNFFMTLYFDKIR